MEANPSVAGLVVDREVAPSGKSNSVERSKITAIRDDHRAVALSVQVEYDCEIGLK